MVTMTTTTAMVTMRRERDRFVIPLGSTFLPAALFLAAPGASGADLVKIERLEGKVRVEIGGELFAEYDHSRYPKPILYPVLGPGGVPMTRSFPMKTIVPGESKDHPHQRSLWFTHGAVNGVSFWHENPGAGRIVHEKFLEVRGGERGVIRCRNRWVQPDGKVVCRDTTAITFQGLDGARAIDFEVTLEATEGPVTLGDTKEGTMGIRTHPNLRLRNDPRQGVMAVSGKALNSEGATGKDLWGKRAKWVDYWGEIGGKTVGVAIFDHPSNPRHPTWWHARDYGLVAANPFGVHDFEGKPRGTGDMKIPAGGSVTFRYRFLFHEGDPGTARIAERYAEYAR